MAILDTVKKFGLRVKTATGYITYKLGSEFVQMDNGKDLQTAFDDLNDELNSKPDYITAEPMVDQVAYNIGDLYVLLGTQTWDVSGEYFQAWRRSDLIASFIRAFPFLSEQLNTNKPAPTMFSITICNGDSASQAVHLYTPEYWTSPYDAWFVYSYPNMSGRIRLNYEIRLYPVGTM